MKRLKEKYQTYLRDNPESTQTYEEWIADVWKSETFDTDEYRAELEVWDVTLMDGLADPCKFDHNAECLVCDCWPASCAYERYLQGDYSYETREELEKMFKDYDR